MNTVVDIWTPNAWTGHFSGYLERRHKVHGELKRFFEINMFADEWRIYKGILSQDFAWS